MLHALNEPWRQTERDNATRASGCAVCNRCAVKMTSARVQARRVTTTTNKCADLARVKLRVRVLRAAQPA
eukprot:6099138-Alexandrium_andersonii.AAC.1